MDFTENEGQLERPCTKFLEWETNRTIEKVQLSGGKTTDVKTVDGGYFEYWDKEEGAKKRIELPLRFVVLNSNYFTIKGFNKDRYKGLYSNEVDGFNFPNDLIKVKCGNETMLEFKAKDWQINKKTIQGLGGKYTKSVYILLDNGGGNYEIVNLQLTGSAFSGAQELDKVTKKPVITDKNDGWLAFEIQNSKSFTKRWVEVNKTKLKTSEMGEYTIPVFELGSEITAEEVEICKENATKVKNYLSSYSAKNRENKETAVEQEVNQE